MPFNNILKSKWLFVLIVFDISFLPMFHIYFIPIKLCYLLLIFTFVDGLFKRYYLNPENRALLIFSLLFISLSFFSILGNLYFNLYFNVLIFHETLRQVAIFLLAPIAILYGVNQKEGNLNYIVYFIPTYLFLNILVTFYYNEVGWLADFYSLGDERTQKLMEARSPGVFYNPNISSLTMNMMYLMVVVGIKNRAFTYKSNLIIFSLVGMVFIMHVLSGSRNQFLAACMLSLFLIFYKTRGSIFSFIKVGITCIIIFFGVFGIINSLESRSVNVRWGLQNVASIFSVKNIIGSEKSKGHLYRPIEKLDMAIEKFLFSPIFGSGADGSSDTFAGAQLHNDWLDTLVTSGIIGLIIFIAIVHKSVRLGGGAMLVPFLLPGMTNSFIRAPQSMMLYFIILGFIIGQQKFRNKPFKNTV